MESSQTRHLPGTPADAAAAHVASGHGSEPMARGCSAMALLRRRLKWRELSTENYRESD
jgi:hypothetical protein